MSKPYETAKEIMDELAKDNQNIKTFEAKLSKAKQEHATKAQAQEQDFDYNRATELSTSSRIIDDMERELLKNRTAYNKKKDEEGRKAKTAFNQYIRSAVKTDKDIIKSAEELLKKKNELYNLIEEYERSCEAKQAECIEEFANDLQGRETGVRIEKLLFTVPKVIDPEYDAGENERKLKTFVPEKYNNTPEGELFSN